MARLLGVVSVVVMLGACGDDGDDGTTPVVNPMTGNPMTGNPMTATAGTTGNPMTATAGTTGNPMTATAGTTGNPMTTTAGTTGNPMTATAGTMSMAGMGGATDDPCADDSGLTGADLHNAVQAFLAMEPGGSCNGMSCHDSAGAPKAGLLLGGVADMSMALSGETSCEAPNLPLVAPGDPMGSYLWLKIYGAEVDEITGEIMGDEATWGVPGNCGQAPGTYGVRMPLGSIMPLSQRDTLVQICDWIQAGATGP